jgi:hypothetical protein
MGIGWLLCLRELGVEVMLLAETEGSREIWKPQ